jgi:glutaredoxin-like protein
VGFLKEEDKEYLRNEFKKNLKREVELLHFTDKNDNSDYLQSSKALLEELVELNDYLTLTVKDCSDKAELEAEGLLMCPSTKIKSSRKGFINFYGIPAGYEFSGFVEDIIDMGSDNLPLPDDVVLALSKIDEPIDIKVFITSACPYCVKAVRTAHLFSLANDNIKASMIDAYGFSDLAREHNVSSVPHIVVNDKVSFIGALPEKEFLSKIMESIE